MCIVFVALEQHPGYKFVILSNRDEALSRPTLRSHFWDPTSVPAAVDSVEVSDVTENTDYTAIERANSASEAATNQILAGRDAVRGGTWLAISKSGRFAVVTNYQEPHEYVLHYDENGKPYVTSEITDMKSRGDLVKDFVSGTMRGDEFLTGVSKEGALYPGFCLIVGDEKGMYLYSNRDPTNSVEQLGCGATVGLTNTLLRPTWFKAERGVSLVNGLTLPDPDVLASLGSDSDFRKTHAPPSPALDDLLAPALGVLTDQVTPELPSSASMYDKAGMYSSIFIPAVDTSPDPKFKKEYGTRCSIAILVDEKNRITFYERALNVDTKQWHNRVYHFTAQSGSASTSSSATA